MKSSPKHPYARPVIIGEVSLEAAGGILAASLVDNSSVKSSGQEIGTVFDDASSTGSSTFNHTWGE